MIRLLLDEGLPRGTALDLQVAGWDAVHVVDLGLRGTSDADLIDRARQDDRVIVTLDSDYSALLAMSGADRPSIVHVRIERFNRTRATPLLLDLIPRIEADLRCGCVATVSIGEVRIRSLPLRT